MEIQVNTTHVLSNMEQITEDFNNVGGIPLYTWFSALWVVMLLAYVLPSWVMNKSYAVVGTIAFFVLIPSFILWTIFTMIAYRTITMIGLGVAELLVLFIIWTITITRSALLYKKSHSWKSFVFGNQALVAVKHHKGTSYFTGDISKSGVTISCGIPKKDYAQIATTSGLFYFPCPALKTSPETIIFIRPTKVVLLKRINQAILQNTDGVESGHKDSTGLLFYKPVKTLSNDQLALWHGSSDADLTNLLD